MKVIASMQPSHAIGDLHFAHKRLGLDRLNNAYTWRSLIDLGVVIAGGSDAPVEIGDPRIEFKAAIGRKRFGWLLSRLLELRRVCKQGRGSLYVY